MKERLLGNRRNIGSLLVEDPSCRGRNGVKWSVGAIEGLVGEWTYQRPRKKADQ